MQVTELGTYRTRNRAVVRIERITKLGAYGQFTSGALAGRSGAWHTGGRWLAADPSPLDLVELIATEEERENERNT